MLTVSLARIIPEHSHPMKALYKLFTQDSLQFTTDVQLKGIYRRNVKPFLDLLPFSFNSFVCSCDCYKYKVDNKKITEIKITIKVEWSVQPSYELFLRTGSNPRFIFINQKGRLVYKFYEPSYKKLINKIKCVDLESL